jgi:hypothetical protein
MVSQLSASLMAAEEPGAPPEAGTALAALVAKFGTVMRHLGLVNNELDK